ncbi:MAG TPA: hydrolase-like protein [Mesotoga infera]|uniref:Hydrolase-like protein n=1 Tax=Mesotoga infera TaxID=1236046 RepID=A0A3D3TJA5_9BACT|nr:hydrolase-like protein [Mesotoga infera]
MPQAGSEARWHEELMLGRTSGEVKLLRRRQKEPVC